MRIPAQRPKALAKHGWNIALCAGLCQVLLVFVVCVCGTISASSALASPPTTALRYFYDGEGHLKALYNPASETALYGWDEAGNLLTVGKKSSSVLSITELAPAEAPVGETVTIDGTGFSTTASNDAVKFNGTTATVSAATAWSLTVKVPTGATTGTVTVKTTTEGPVTSAQTFTVGSPAPHVSSLSATVANSGGTVTINGTNFATPYYEDVVTVNQTRATVLSATSTAIQITVPGATLGGKVSVTTPSGSTTGPDLYIPPEEIAASKVSYTGRFSLGSSITPNITKAENVGLAIFEGTSGQKASFVLSGSTIHRGYVTVWGPEGVKIPNTEKEFESGAYIDTVTLPKTGTYTVLIKPESTYTGSVKVQGYSVVNVTGSLTPTTGGASVSPSLTTPGQNAVYTVHGTPGELVTLVTSSTSFTGGYWVEWINEAGTRLAYSGAEGTQNTYIEQFTLPSSGTDSVVVNPQQASTGSTTVTAYLANNVTTSITPSEAGETKTISIGIPGQKAEVSFSGTEGERVSFAVSEISLPGGEASLINPVGEKFGGGLSIFPGQKSIYEPITLPKTGTYKFFINPEKVTTGSLKLSAYKVVNVTGSLTPTAEGVSVKPTLSTPGQNAVYAIHGTSGEPVTLTTTEDTLTERFGALEWINEAGAQLLYYGFENPEKVYVEKFALPSSGTDSVVVNPQNASTGSIALTAYNASDVTGSITPTTEGESETVSIPAPGQKARITFAGTVGKTVTIKTSESSIASGSAWILNPEGEKIGSEEPIGSGRFEVTPAATGTYTVYLSPSGKDTGSVKVTAYLGSHPGALILRKPSASSQTEASGTPLSNLPNSAPGVALDVNTVGTPVKHDATDAVDVVDGKVAGRGASAQQPRHAVGALSQDKPYKPYVAGPVGERTIKMPPFHLVDSGVWQPLARGHHARWETGWPSSPWTQEPPLYAAAETTALSGQALQIDGMPLAGVRLSIEGTTAKTETDAQGRFLLTGASAGHQVLVIEGEPSHHSGARYGTYEMGVTLVAGKTTTLEETVWLTPLDPAGDHSVGSPVKHEVRLTTPQIPGLEVRIPAGTVITDAAGKKVHNLNLSAIPVDRPPFRLPAFVEVPIYFTVQPGRAYLSKAAQIIYPNYEHLRPGQRVPFWDYDADSQGWYVYGYGSVSSDGKQIVPDPGVGVWEFTGAMISGTPAPPSSRPTGTAAGGDPVDLYSGLFDYHTTDLVLPDTIPIVIERSYRQADSNSYSFGVGTANRYDIRLWSEKNYHEADLILPNGGRVHYVRTSPGEGYIEAEYQSTSTPGPFYASTIKWDAAEARWDLSLTDGLTYEFGADAPLQAIRDRAGDELTITRASHEQGNITQITSPHGRWVTFSYDSSNRITEMKDDGERIWKYSYTTGGLLEKVVDPMERTTKYEYDGSGNMTSITDPRGTKYIENKYDSNDRVSKQTDADGGVFEFKYALNGEGQVESTTVTEPRENKRKVTFNSEGLSTSEILGFESALEQKTEIERQTGTNLILSTTDARKRKTAYEYDAYGNPTSITRLAGTSSAQTTKFTYEPLTDELTKVTDPLGHATKYEYGTKGELLTVTDPLGHKTTAEYNSSGQPTVIKNALGKSTTYAYELGLLTGVTDAANRTTKQFFDNIGRVMATVRPEGQRTIYGYDADNDLTSITGAGGAQTGLEYDADGDLTSITDPRHNKTTATYESMDRLESETDPLGHKTSWTYNKAGYPIEATDRRGFVTKATYDTLGRMSKISFGVSGETAQSSIKYEYDNGNRPTKIEDSAAGGTYTPTYNELDQLTALAGPNGTVEYAYDGADRRKKLIVPGQEAIEYTYDEANRLTELARGTEKIKLGYDNANRPTSVKLLDGIEETLGYNEANDPTSIIDKKGSETLGELDYAYNKDDQLEATWGSYARTGLPEAITTPLVYNADNELTERAGKTLAYDNDGNLTSDATNTYKWDDRGQLESISGGTTASFGYDPFGRRSSKTLAGTTTKLLYDGPNVVQESVGGTATGNLITGLGADQIFSRKTSTGTDSYLTNPQKSTIALANSEGKVKTTYTYDPFGTTTTEGTASTNPYQYTGRENDGDGLQYNRARYYNPTNARFISQDPTGFEGSDANLYQYTLGDPLDYTDPTGLCRWDLLEAKFWTEGNCASENPVKAIQTAGIAGCIIATAGGCSIIAGFVAAGGVADDVVCKASPGQFAGTIGLSLLGAGPGLIFGGLKAGGMITDTVLPDTMAGKWALNGYLTGPAAGSAVAEAAATSPGGPGGSPGGAPGGSSGGTTPGGSPGGSAATSSGESGGSCE